MEIRDNDGYPDPASIYDTFSPTLFAIDPLGWLRTDALREYPALRGMQMQLWSDTDNAFSESHVATRLAPLLRALAQIASGIAQTRRRLFPAFAVLIAAIGDPP